MGDNPRKPGSWPEARAGDTRAFDALITLHREKIYMHIYQIVRNEEDALDLTQETFIRAWKSLPRFDGKASLTSWLYRIATNASIDLCRKRQHRPQTELETGPDAHRRRLSHHPSQPEALGTGHDRAEIRRRVDLAFAELSPEHRAVIALKEIEDLSYEEIAHRVGCSVGTVMSRLFYARKKLQSLLSDLHEEL